MRWPIVRNLLVLLGVVGAITVAAKRKNKDPEPVVETVPQPPPAPTVDGLFEGGPPVALQAVPEGLANITAQSCNACHVQIHDDWQTSAHAVAGNSETYREAVARAGDSSACLACHYPLANQHEELAAGYLDGDLTRPDLQPNPSWDATLMAEGVGCAACHVREGYVVSTRAAPNAPHPVAVAEELGTSEMCATCHQLTWPEADKPFYDTYGEWQRSAYKAAGVGCADCHMALSAGDATGTSYAAQASHEFSSDPRRALSVLVDLDTSDVQRGEAWSVRLTLQNTGAGHSFPTGSPFKAYIVTIELIDAEGKSLAEPHTVRLGRTIEEEPPWNTTADDRIDAGGERAVEASLEVSQRKSAGRAHLEVRLEKEGASDGDRWVLQKIPVQIM